MLISLRHPCLKNKNETAFHKNNFSCRSSWFRSWVLSLSHRTWKWGKLKGKVQSHLFSKHLILLCLLLLVVQMLRSIHPKDAPFYRKLTVTPIFKRWFLAWPRDLNTAVFQRRAWSVSEQVWTPGDHEAVERSGCGWELASRALQQHAQGQALPSGITQSSLRPAVELKVLKHLSIPRFSGNCLVDPISLTINRLSLSHRECLHQFNSVYITTQSERSFPVYILYALIINRCFFKTGSFLQSETVQKLQITATTPCQGGCFSLGPNLTIILPKPCVAS